MTVAVINTIFAGNRPAARGLLAAIFIVSSLTPLNIVAIGIVRRAYKDSTAFHVWTCQCIRLESMTLKIEVKDFEDLDENWLANVPCLNACVPNSALLGRAVCTRYILVHFLKNERTNTLSGSVRVLSFKMWIYLKRSEFAQKCVWVFCRYLIFAIEWCHRENCTPWPLFTYWRSHILNVNISEVIRDGAKMRRTICIDLDIWEQMIAMRHLNIRNYLGQQYEILIFLKQWELA